MAIEIVEKYVNELIDRSTLDEPVWNIEKIILERASERIISGTDTCWEVE